MAENEVIIKFTADTRQAQAGINSVGNASKSLMDKIRGATRGFQDINAAFSTVRGVVRGVTDTINDLIGSFVDYGMQVDQFTRATGMSAEASSKLIQAADDVFISFETLQASMKIALRQGIDPSIEGMMKLSDEYLAIQDPIKRSQFLLEKFGRGGLDMGKLLEKGSDAIRELGEEAEKTGLVLSQNDVEAARLFKEELDALNDKVEATKIKLGRDLVRAANDAYDAFNLLTNGSNELVDVILIHREELARAGVSYEEFNAEMERSVNIADGTIWALSSEYKEMLKLSEAQYESYRVMLKYGDYAAGDYVKSLITVTEETENETSAIDALRASMDTSVEDENRRFIESQTKIRDEMSEVVGQIDALNKKKYLTPEQKTELDDLYNKHRDLASQYATNATAHEKATAKIIFDIYMQKAAMDGVVDDIELAALSAYAATSGLISETQAATLAAANKDWEALKARYDEIDGRVINVTYNTRITGQTPPGFGEEDMPPSGYTPPPGESDEPIYGGMQAAGGDYMVTRPTTFTAGEAGAERVSVKPAGNTYNIYGIATPEHLVNRLRALEAFGV